MAKTNRNKDTFEPVTNVHAPTPQPEVAMIDVSKIQGGVMDIGAELSKFPGSCIQAEQKNRRW